jgi:formate hydrogenlyase subunit 6/NADH:ubiquinone oxidoreductase subunit I
MERELLKNAAGRPVTIHYPYEETPTVKDMRAKVTWKIETCIGCGLCPQVCPSSAIKMSGKGNNAEITYLLERCIFCGECIDICPTKTIKVTTEYELTFTSRNEMTVQFKRSGEKIRKNGEKRR